MNSNNSCVLLGKIYTIDDSLPEAGGVAIHHGRIAYVGNAKEARRQGGPQAEVIDLAGRVALPGFVESHSHPILLGRYLEEADCRYCSSLEGITETLRQRAKETPPGQWVVGNGYDHTLLKEARHPTRSELDRASDEHPVLLRNITVHNVVANSRALGLAGVTSKTPDPGGGRIGRDVSGEPDGVLWEWAQDLVNSHLPETSVEDVRRQLANATEEYLSAGVTSVVDAALGLANGMRDAEAYARVAEDGGLSVRLGAAIVYPLWKELQGGAGPGVARRSRTGTSLGGEVLPGRVHPDTHCGAAAALLWRDRARRPPPDMAPRRARPDGRSGRTAMVTPRSSPSWTPTRRF